MYRLGKQSCLVVATLKEPGPMQRHRDKQVGASEYVRAGTLHPPPEGGGGVCMVAMLEPEQQAAAVLVVTQYGARLVPDGPVARAVATDSILTHRMGKGQTAKQTPRRREEGDPAPTPTAQRIRLFDHLATREAARRQNTVDKRPTDPPQSIGCPGSKGCRGLHNDTSSGCGCIRQPAAEKVVVMPPKMGASDGA